MRSARHITRRVSGSVLGAVLLAALALAPSASAAMLHSVSPFSPITGAGIGTTIPQPTNLAVDEVSGNLFATSGFEPATVVKILDSEGGPPVGLTSPFELTGFQYAIDFVGLAIDNSATSPNQGTLYVTDPGHLTVKKFVRNPGTEKYEAAGELTPVPPFSTFEGESGRPAGVAVDEAGNVYVSIRFEKNGFGSIVKFSPTGTQLARIPASEATRGPEDMAVDGDGDLFVIADFGLFVYPANGLGEIEADNFTKVPVVDVRGVAVDRAADILYAARNTHVTEIDASSLQEKGDFGEGVAGEANRGLAVNEAEGLLYVANSSVPGVLAFNLNGPTIPDVSADPPSSLKVTSATLQGTVDPEGLEVTECKFEYRTWNQNTFEPSVPCAEALPTDSSRHPVSAQTSGLTPGEIYEYRLVVKNANGTQTSAIKRFTTKQPAETTAATAIGTEGATVNGIVRPEGSAVTECKFEYGLEETFQETGAYEATLPCDPDPGSIPADSEPHEVSAELSGLLVGTTYRFRLVSTGSFGTTKGEGLTFSTGGPSVLGTDLSALGETTATLEARIDPRGKATIYHFEYGTEGPCGSSPCTSVPAPDEPVGDGTSAVAVFEQIKGLDSATTYDYRVVVANADGTGHSKDGTFTTYDVPPTFGTCPNDTFRLGHPSARLPDCRAYERASPAEKGGNDIGGQLYKVQASLSGDAITWQVKNGMPGNEGAQSYPLFLSRFSGGEWSTRGILPPPSFGDNVLTLGWTPDLRNFFMRSVLTGSNLDAPGLDNALLMRDTVTGAVRELTPYVDKAQYALAGASADGSKVFFEALGEGVALTSNAAKGKQNLFLYEPASEELSLVGVLPASQGGKAPPAGSAAGPYEWWLSGWEKGTIGGGGAIGAHGSIMGEYGYYTQEMHAISTDGSKAFFTAAGTGQIYLREGLGGEDPPQSVQVSASQAATPDPNGPKPAIFTGATPDGSIAFFLSCQKLTDDSTAVSTAANTCMAPAQGQELYAYDTATHELSDLTADDDPQGAEVVAVIGNSEDGSYVYFAANGDLDGSGPAQAGDCERAGNGIYDYSGSCSLYVWHGGSSTFVAKLDVSGLASDSDAANWMPGPEQFSEVNTARVSADGQTIVFRSKREQTDYENSPSDGLCTGLDVCPQFYRYRFGEAEPSCVTCNPTGLRPRGIGRTWLQSLEAGIVFAAHPIQSRFVSADGNRVFFETPEKLAGVDTNGDDGCPAVKRPGIAIPSCQDVYEWEAPGTGSCSKASTAYSEVNQGCLYLLSTGTSPDPSYFGDASASGDHVFIFTGDRLVPGDEDGLFDVYDVRVGGGLASQNPPPPPEICVVGTCRGAGTTPPSIPSAGSAGFQGPGDPQRKRCPKGKVRKGGKCVKKSHKPRKHHQKRQAKQRAGAERGGQK
jgi:hypothetical protein